MKTLFRLWRKFAEQDPWRSGVVIFALAMCVRLAFLFAFHTYTDLSRVELEKTAISLATTGVYGNPYALPTGPSAHVAPGYTLILAGIFKLFGTGVPAEIVKRLLATVVSSLLWGLLPVFAKEIEIAPAFGVSAGLLGALYAARPLVEIEGDWETPYTALALVLITGLSYRLWTRRDLRMGRAFGQGLLWGISLLFVPALLDIFIAFAVAGIYFCESAGLKRYFQFVAVEVVALGLCLSPWIVRNYYALGSPVVTRTNLGLELRISNNDEASPDQRVNFLNGLFDKYHPLLSKPEAMKVKTLGEVAYNKWAENEAKLWMRQHPVRFFELCLGRVRCYWVYHDPTSPVKTFYLAVINLLGFTGLVYLFRMNLVAAEVITVILVMYPLPNYLVHVGLRQEYPLQWVMLLLASVCLLRRYRSKKTTVAALS